MEPQLTRDKLDPRVLNVLKAIKNLGGTITIKPDLMKLYDEAYKSDLGVMREKKQNASEDELFWNLIMQLKRMRLVTVAYGVISITPEGNNL